MSSRRGCGKKRDNDIVWRMLNDVFIYHRVDAGERKTPIGRGQKQLALRVDLLNHDLCLISRLRERVKPRAEEKRAVNLCQIQYSTMERFHRKRHIR